MTVAWANLKGTGNFEHFVHFSLCIPLCRAAPNSVVSYRVDHVMMMCYHDNEQVMELITSFICIDVIT